MPGPSGCTLIGMSQEQARNAGLVPTFGAIPFGQSSGSGSKGATTYSGSGRPRDSDYTAGGKLSASVHTRERLYAPYLVFD